jgi:RNA polymerase sigma factor (sigma-70 family)
MRGAALEAATVTTAHPPVAGRSDHQLVSLVRAGDDRAFEELFTRYRRRITAYVYGMVSDHGRAEDISQEVFVSALRRMRETERPIAFRPWIYEIAKNACIDAFRRRSRAEEVSLTSDDGLHGGDHLRLVSSTPAPDETIEVKQRLNHLCGAFGGLSEAHHEILVLRELEGLSYREIGERMGLSRPAVESTLFRARRRLTEEYDELASGARCARVQAIISSAAAGELAGRDQRRMARHVAHCQDCRRHARSLGVAMPAAGARGARRLAALLPLPLLGRRRADEAVAAHAHGGLAAQVVNALPAAEPLAANWGKAAATLATLAVAGFGAGSAAQHAGLGGSPSPRHAPPVGRLAGDVAKAARAATVAVDKTRVVLPASARRALGGGPVPSGERERRGGGSAGREDRGEGGGGSSAEARGGTDAGRETSAVAGAGGDAGTPSLPSAEVPSAKAPDAPSAPKAEAPKLDAQAPQAPSAPSAPAPPQAPEPPSAPAPPAVAVQTPSPPDTSGATSAASSATSSATSSLPSVP